MHPSTSRLHWSAWLLICAATHAQNLPLSLKDQPPLWSAKPDVAAFEKLENDRLAAAQRAIDQIVRITGPRTIENTLTPYDEAIRQLNAAGSFSIIMQEVHPDAAYRDRATAMNTKVSDIQTALSLNKQVYEAIAALDVSQADAATRYYVKRQLLEFHLAGVDKNDVTRARIRKLQNQLTQDQSMFDRNIADNPGSIEIASVSDLEGLPQDYIEAHKPGPDGKIRITTAYPDYFPVMKFANKDDVRRRLHEAFISRAYPKNRDVLLDMLRSRYEIATLVGYSSWADYNAADKMILNAGNIAKFVQDLDTAARPIAQREYAMLLAELRKTDPTAAEISVYNARHVEEQVLHSQYDFDSQSVRPYLPYNQVEQGILDIAAKLFNVTFRQELSSPAWDPSVETWDVFDGNQAVGRFYLDMHPRPGKYSHGAMVPILDGIRDRQLPEAALVCNFPRTTASDPGLMDYGDVVALFHEFGHLMHHILGGQQQWAGISGVVTVEADFWETPSQMLEGLLRSPQVLATFAHHYKTGKPIPSDLVTRMNRASAFGRGLDVTDQIAFAAVSYDLHKDKPQGIDPDAVTITDFRRYSLPATAPSEARLYASFGHLGGYSSMVYTYMWDKVIAEDFFAQFDQNDLLAGPTPMRYRRTVLEPGGSTSAIDLVKNFLGRPQNTLAFQRWLGEEFESAPQSTTTTGH
jgi:thimet oligopeptidase